MYTLCDQGFFVILNKVGLFFVHQVTLAHAGWGIVLALSSSTFASADFCFANSKDFPIVTTTAITSKAACKSLFSGGVCCSPGIMCAIEWCDVALLTADEGSTGRQVDWNAWGEVRVLQLG